MTAEPVFFVDRALGGIVFPGILDEAGISVVRRADRFAQGVDRF